MKISQSIAGVLLASALATSHAAPLPPSSGFLAPTTVKLDTKTDNEGGFSAYFGNAFVLDTDYAKYFTNDYTFSVGPSGLAAGSLTASFVSNKKDVYISGFNIFTDGGSLVSTGVSTAGASNQTGAMDTWALPDTSLTSGAYYLEVTGQVLGTKGGSYGGEMSVTAVPEPETYAMMASGLAFVGFVARRRKSKAS